MIRGESEPPSSFHHPEGIGVGKVSATGCCTPGGNSPQLLKKIATVVRGRSPTSWIDFMKHGRYTASLRRSTATLHWTLVPCANPHYATHSRNRIPTLGCRQPGCGGTA